MWKQFYKQENECDLAKETFFKMLNLRVHAHISKERKYGSIPTISSLVNSICSTIVNISVHFKYGRLGLAFTKQHKIEELLKTGFSLTIQSSAMLYEMIELF